jgi:hypothetical protein
MKVFMGIILVVLVGVCGVLCDNEVQGENFFFDENDLESLW